MHASLEPNLFALQRADLVQLASAARLRRLVSRNGIDFASNDYLGLASSFELASAAHEAIARGVPIGSGGSRLLRGNHEEHELLEAEAAEFFGSEAALFFSSGYAANSALFATLPQKGDLIIHDALVHASVREGLRLSRADCVAARHNDSEHVERLAREWRQSGNRTGLWLAVESLYSMDGDQAPLDALASIADRYGGTLVIDEAHATGVFGAEGRGLAHAIQRQPNVITLRTCGKALGCEGALICSPRIVREFLINRGRGFIFSTAPSPLMAALVRASLGLLRDEVSRRERLWEHIRTAQAVFRALDLPTSGSQIQPLIIGNNAETMKVAEDLQARGFDIRGVRPPTVPEGTARLRISITLNSSPTEIEALGSTLHTLLPETVST